MKSEKEKKSFGTHKPPYLNVKVFLAFSRKLNPIPPIKVGNHGSEK